MTTTFAPLRPAPVNGNGHKPAHAIRGRSINRARIATGVLLVVLCTLATVALVSRSSKTTTVLVADRTITPGETIGASDVRAATLGSSSDLSAVPASRASEIVGRIASYTIPRGALVTEDLLGSGPSIPVGSETTGAIVKPGQYPVDLRVGDRVRIIESTAGDSSAEVEGHERTAAVVTAIERAHDGNGGIAVSLAVPSEASPEVAAAGAAGRLSLVVVEQR